MRETSLECIVKDTRLWANEEASRTSILVSVDIIQVSDYSNGGRIQRFKFGLSGD